jgi:hypothetical protein
MEMVDERPVWSMRGGELLSTLDQLDATLARFETYRLQVIAGLDEIGYAQEIGAHDTSQLLEFRYRLDRSRARRDVRLARSLARYDAVSAALPSGGSPREGSEPGDGFESRDGSESAEDEAAEVLLRPAQAEAIVAALEQVPATVPAEDLEVAERELVGLAGHLSPAELRRAGQRIRDVLDTDGPEPEEHKAYARETLTLASADRGVKFRGYLANENAELLRSLIHAGARPHKTADGELDPRSREKRQADALTTALTIAATTWDDTTPSTGTSTAGPSAEAGRRSGRASTPSAGGSSVGASAEVGSCCGRGSTPSAGAGSAGASAEASSRSGRASTPSAGTSPVGHSAEASSCGGRALTPSAGTTPAGASTADESGRRGRTGAVGASAVEDGSRSGRTSGQVPGFGAKASLTVTIDWQDLKSATADAIGDTVYGDGLSAATIRRLACDAKIIPLVLGTNSEPLDVGRSERLVTRAMRRALNARDRGCVVCGAPPIMCDAHHLTSWIDGGETKLTNLALLCRRHHIDLHAGDWTITIQNGRVQVSRPLWADTPRPTVRPIHPPTTPQQPHPPRPPAQPATESRPPTLAGQFPPARQRSREQQRVGATAPPTPSSHEAATLAIWGEPPPPASPRPHPRAIPLNPWADPSTPTQQPSG